jgi:hypothetical protein
VSRFLAFNCHACVGVQVRKYARNAQRRKVLREAVALTDNPLNSPNGADSAAASSQLELTVSDSGSPKSGDRPSSKLSRDDYQTRSSEKGPKPLPVQWREHQDSTCNPSTVYFQSYVTVVSYSRSESTRRTVHCLRLCCS